MAKPPRRSAWADDDLPVTTAAEQVAVSDSLPDTWAPPTDRLLPDTWVVHSDESAQESAGQSEEREEGTKTPSPSHNNSTAASPVPANRTRDMLDSIAAPPKSFYEEQKPKRIRSRDWDKQHQREIIQFRAIPVWVYESVMGLADEMRVSTGNIARRLLSYGLDCYHRRLLSFSPALSAGKFTLFPQKSTDGGGGWSRNTGKRTPKKIPRKKAKPNRKKSGDLTTVTYREIPVDVQTNLREIADERHVPITEIARMFMEFALHDYELGVLMFTDGPD